MKYTKKQFEAIKRYSKNPLGCIELHDCVYCDLNYQKGSPEATSGTCIFRKEILLLPHSIEEGIHITCKKILKLEVLKEILK